MAKEVFWLQTTVPYEENDGNFQQVWFLVGSMPNAIPAASFAKSARESSRDSSRSKRSRRQQAAPQIRQWSPEEAKQSPQRLSGSPTNIGTTAAVHRVSSPSPQERHPQQLPVMTDNGVGSSPILETPERSSPSPSPSSSLVWQDSQSPSLVRQDSQSPSPSPSLTPSVVGKELVASLQQLVNVQREELTKYKASSGELAEAQRQIRMLQARLCRTEQERLSHQRRLDEERAAREGLQASLETIEARHEVELRAQLERLTSAAKAETQLLETLETQQWLRNDADAERDAAFAEEMRLATRAHERKLADSTKLWEAKLGALSEERDAALAAAELQRQRADELALLLQRAGAPIPADLAHEQAGTRTPPDWEGAVNWEHADAAALARALAPALGVASAAAPAAAAPVFSTASAAAADLLEAFRDGPCVAIARVLGFGAEELRSRSAAPRSSPAPQQYGRLENLDLLLDADSGRRLRSQRPQPPSRTPLSYLASVAEAPSAQLAVDAATHAAVDGAAVKQPTEHTKMPAVTPLPPPDAAMTTANSPQPTGAPPPPPPAQAQAAEAEAAASTHPATLPAATTLPAPS